MTLKEKINHSAKLTQFILFKEGLFYKCYNEDAMDCRYLFLCLPLFESGIFEVNFSLKVTDFQGYL